IGGLAAPFDLVLEYSDGTSDRVRQSPLLWQSNQKQVTVPVKGKKKISSYYIDGRVFMDADESNNSFKLK
ncbi:MAG TPA: hypothetical protein VJT83_02180, partial [Chitinophagaceae bacterium]|nr:hypothetical protein [Chitinophagaceae bacterium]